MSRTCPTNSRRWKCIAETLTAAIGGYCQIVAHLAAVLTASSMTKLSISMMRSDASAAGMNSPRRHLPAGLLVRPPDQRLGRRNIAALHIDLRLPVKGEFAVAESCPQPLAQCQNLVTLVEDVGVIELETRFAARLRLVEREVGELQHLVKIAAVRRPDGGAARATDVDVGIAEGARPIAGAWNDARSSVTAPASTKPSVETTTTNSSPPQRTTSASWPKDATRLRTKTFST